MKVQYFPMKMCPTIWTYEKHGQEMTNRAREKYLGLKKRDQSEDKKICKMKFPSAKCQMDINWVEYVSSMEELEA